MEKKKRYELRCRKNMLQNSVLSRSFSGLLGFFILSFKTICPHPKRAGWILY